MSDPKMTLAYDLRDLLTVANENIGAVSEQFHAATGAVDATVGLQGAFGRPDHFGGGRDGAAMTAWARLRDTYVNALKETRTSLDLTAEALRLCARVYANADGEVRDDLLTLGVPESELRL